MSHLRGWEGPICVMGSGLYADWKGLYYVSGNGISAGERDLCIMDYILIVDIYPIFYWFWNLSLAADFENF